MARRTRRHAAARNTTSSVAPRPRAPLPLPLSPSRPLPLPLLSLSLSLILFLAVLATYSPIRDHGAIPFDDPSYVTENEHVQAGLGWAGVRWAFSSVHAHNWHPLTWLSHMLDVELFGRDLGLHHLSSVVLHAATAALLLWFLAATTEAILPSFAVAALFALHPLRVESVAWLAERKDTLSAFLFAVTLVVWSAFQRRRGEPRARIFYLASLAAYTAGLLAKPMLVSLPFVLLLLDVWPFARWRGDGAERAGSRLRPVLLEKLPFFALAAAISIGTLLAQQAIVKPLATHPLDDRVVNALASCWIYLGKLLWPTDLAIFYPYDADRFGSGAVALFAAGLAGVTTLAVLQVRRRPYLFTGWLWYLVTLAPVLGLVQTGLQARADRYTYLPSVGVLVALVWLAAELGRAVVTGRRARELAAAGAVLLLAIPLAGATREQLALWRGPEVLYGHAAAVTLDNDWAHYNLAQLALRRGDDESAERHLAEVVRIVPRNPEALRNLAAIAARRGDLDRAGGLYERAVSVAPEDPYARRDLGELLLQRGEVAEAAEELTRALELQPDDSQALYLLGTIRFRQGQLEVAEGLLRRALAEDEAHAGAHNALGVAAASRGDLAAARRHFAKAVALEPDYAEARRNLELVAAREVGERSPEGGGGSSDSG